MALKSTIFKFDVQLADLDNGHYADYSLTLARHPSETDERMMARVVALALNAHQVQSLCGGDARLGFGAGLSSPDEPDVQLVDFTGRICLWLEVGQPEEKPISRAAARADAVGVYAFGPAAEVWWRGMAGKVARLDKLRVWRLPAEPVAQLAAMVERTMRLHATVQDGVLTLGDAGTSVVIEPQVWK